jgi:hypothetical protein
MRIRALREDGAEVPARFRVDGGADTTASTWDFVAPAEGDYVVDAASTLDGVEYTGRWTVTVTTAIVPPTPTVQIPSAVEGTIPGSIDLQWNAPPSSLVPVPLAEYIVGYSTSPFDSLQFDSVDHTVVPHDSGAILQHVRLEGLDERVRYYIRIVVQDVLDRRSSLSPTVQRESTGHFDVTGTVYSLDTNQPLLPLANVLVEVAGVKELTDAGGAFALLNLPDIAPQPLIAQEQSASNYYVYQTAAADPVTRDEHIVLFPQEILEIEPATADLDNIMSRLEYVQRMTNNYTGSDYRTHPWASYPVNVFLGDYVSPSGLHYREILHDAIDTWNAAFGDSLLRPIDADMDPQANPTARGARVVPDLPVIGGALLGKVDVAIPAGGVLFEVDPEFLNVHMRSDFGSREVTLWVASHELGHVLGLAHSPNRYDLMCATPRLWDPPVGSGPCGSPCNIPTDEEVLVVRLLRNIPAGTDMRWYARTVLR